MLRRSRISVRPNVRPAGRGPAPASSQDTPPSQEAPAAVSQASEDLPQAGGQCVKDTTTTAVLEASTESTTPREDGKDPNGEGSSSTPSAGLQRRKRFSVMPNLAKPRVAATPALTRSSPRTPKSPVRAGTETPAPTPEAPEAPRQTDSGPSQGMRSPRRRPSGGSRQAKGQPKPRPLSPASPGPTTTSLGNVAVENSSLSQQTPQAAGKGSIQSDLLKKTPIIKVPSTPLEMVPSSSLPDKEGISVSERAKTLVARSVSGGLTGLAPGKSRLSRFLNDPTDLQRLAKARKLRELLRQEMNKEKKRSKAKVCVSEYTLDPSKMTMRDLIYYLPDTNPMTSYLVEEQKENETVLPLTPPREESPERLPTPEAPAEIASQGDEDEDEDDDGVMVPRVKVAEDGSLIIDEESLTVEVLRQKGPNPADDRDPIFERGSTTTYSSFRKGTHVKPWSNKETDMFFLAISMVGTDFSMIGQLFPHRGRTEIKNKFKKEERANSWRIDKAFKEKRRLDHEFFTSLLEKILAAEAKRNKNKSPTEKIRMKKKIKQKEKKAAKQLSDVEEEGLDAEMDTEEVEGEKENENVSNEGTTLSSAPTPKRKRKSRDGGGESSPEEAKDGKKKKIDLITSDQEEAGVPEDSEAGPPESSKQAEGPVEAAKGPVVIKPAQLSRGRSQIPLPNLGRKWGQRGPEPNTKPNVKDGATPTEEENTEEGLSEEQVDTDASPSVSQKEKKKAGKLSSSEGEEEEASDKPIKPTRYGRIPKKTQLLNYPAKEDGDSPSDSAPTPASDGSPSTMPKSKPATRRAKIKPGPALPGRMGQSAARKSKLVTLRASQSEDDEDEEEGAWREEVQAEEDTHNPTSPEEENQAPAFIPMSLRSPQPVATEVEETMEEVKGLDISVNVPDVLGISHDAFCPDSSCERAQGAEMGTVPCEHQLDLLVDVIDFLSPDNMEVSEESYNEAARTLLAIGNLTHLSQAAEAFTAGADDIITEGCSNEDQLYQMTPQPTDQLQTSTIPSESLRVTEASQIAEDSVPVASSTTASVPVTTTTASIPGSKITASVIVTMATASVPVTTTTSSPPVTLTTTASIRVTTSTASVPVPQSSDTPTLETPPIEEGPLRQREGTDIGHASQVESGSEVSEGSEQQTTSQTRRSHFPKVKPNLGRAARTTQPKQTTTTLSEPPQTTTTLSEPPPEPMLNITTTPEPQPTMHITIEPPLPSESINTESETQPKQRTTTHSKSQSTTTHSKHQPTTNIIPHSEPPPIQKTRIAYSKPQPALNTTTQSEQPQPTLNSTTNTLSKQQSTQSTTILSQPQPTSSLEQPGPVTLRPKVPESPLRSTGEVKGHDGRKGNTSSSLSAGGSQSGTSNSDEAKQTGPLTRRARLPKPKPNLGLTAKATTRSAVQLPESRPCPEVQTPEEADEVPIEIQKIHQVSPLSDIIDTTQEEIQQIHQVIPHPPIEGPLRQREGTDIGHASQVESGSEVSEGSEQQTTSQTRRSHFPKVKPNLGRAARTTQPKQTTTTLSEPPLDSMLNIITTSEPQPTMHITIEPPLPSESINTESETQPKQRTTTHSKSQPTTNIIPHSGPQPSQRTRVAHSKPQPALNTTTQSEQPQPTLNSPTNTLSKQQSTQSTTILSQPQPTSSLEQPGPVTLRPRVPESPLRSSEAVKGHDGSKENSSSSLSAGGSQSGTSNSDEPKQTGPPTRRARLPKPKPNLGCTAKAATRSAVQVSESRPSPEVQTPEEADEVPMEIQQIHQVVPLSDIIDTTQEEIQQIHQVIPHPPIEGPLRQREGTDIGHASQVESGSEVSEGSEQQTTSQTRRSHFPKVKPNLGRAARTTQPKQTTTTLSEPPQTTTTLSEPQPSQRTRVAHSKPQPALNTTTQSEQPQPTLNSPTNTFSKQQSTQSTTILSQPQPTSSLEQPGPVTLRPIVPESPLRSSEEVKGHDGPKGNTSSSLSAGGSQSGTSNSDEAKQTGPLTRRAHLPKPKPNLGLTAKAATRSAVQVPESRPCPEVQTPEEADEVPIEIQQIHQVFPLCDIIDTTQEEIQQIHQVIPHPPIEGPLRQREGTDIGHASQVESVSEVSEGSEQQTTSQTRRSHFPKVKPNLGQAARTTQPKQTTTTLSEPPQTTTTLSEPQPIQKTRIAYSKPQPALNTTTQSEQPQPTLNSPTNTLSKQQSTQSTTILSQPQPTSSLEQPGPVTLRPRVPESPLRSSGEVKGHDGPKENSSSSFNAGGSQSGTSDSDQPKQTGPLTRRARLPKPKPNLGLTARAATRSAVQLPEHRPNPEVQTPEEADEVPMEIQQIHQVSPLCDIIDTTQEEMEQIHQVIPLTDVIDSTQGDMSLFTEGSFFSQQSDAVFIQHSETSVSTAPLDQAQSDPDEPIFILSLTEIPVLPAGEENGCTSQTLSEPFFFLPDAGAQLQQSSDIVAPRGSLEKGNAGVLCEVPEPMSVDEVLPQPSYTSIKEVESGSTAGPVGVCASAKPSEDSMADAETSEDTHPPKKRKVPERARRVDKLQVRPNTAVREQTSCSAPAKEAVSPITPDQTPSLTTTTLDTYHLTASSPLAQPGPSVTGTASQQGTVGCFDRTETEHTPTGGEDNSSGAESQAARQITPLAMSGPLSRPGRRPRGFLSFMSNKNASPVAAPPRGTRAAALRPQVNTTRPGGKRAAPAPSTTTRTMPSPSIMHYTTTPTRATTKPDFSTRVTQEKPSDALALHSDPEPSTSLCTTATESSQVPAAQSSASPCVDSGSADEEPINVSQYFFSDIFTEVEENEG
ncbi:transcription factor TFIIIB component B'' homolog isoform X1 [Oncorhynchus kisutch]|uniref:transcription factor TFIIIB component B'' homolog isoform X1 n=1 Tax=Oncorhynchus kisutch TaxID=8019 RepID=UPI0012DE6B58|nr:transcription factor TFIIIB component B'' homolog isoform X1 [Oncorhynchus kisutch]